MDMNGMNCSTSILLVNYNRQAGSLSYIEEAL